MEGALFPKEKSSVSNTYTINEHHDFFKRNFPLSLVLIRPTLVGKEEFHHDWTECVGTQEVDSTKFWNMVEGCWVFASLVHFTS